MRSFILLAVICSFAITLACSSSDPVTPISQQTNRWSNFEIGRITVHVYWADQGVPGKTVEVLERGVTRITDSNGIAIFRVLAGTLTVRVYDVNRGGPSLRYVDTKVSVTAGDDVHVEVQDCLPCD